MNEPKVQDLDYINFLLATPRVVSATEGARVQPEGERRAAHDAFTRMLHRLEPDTTPLWREAELLIDDATRRREAPSHPRAVGH
jgi:putative transposase